MFLSLNKTKHTACCVLYIELSYTTMNFHYELPPGFAFECHLLFSSQLIFRTQYWLILCSWSSKSVIIGLLHSRNWLKSWMFVHLLEFYSRFNIWCTWIGSEYFKSLATNEIFRIFVYGIYLPSNCIYYIKIFTSHKYFNLCE